MKNLLLIVVFLFLNIGSIFGAYFVYTVNLNEAQHHLIALRLNKAQLLIKAEQEANPENVACDYLLAYVAFYKIMMRQQEILEPQYEKVKNATLDKIKLLPEEHQYKQYLLGSVHLQGAFVKATLNQYLSAALEFRNAYVNLDQSRKKHPGFLTHQKDIGALEALLGTFPDNYKWIVSAAGLSGTFEGGMSTLRQYIEHASKEPIIEQQQAAIFYALIELNFGSDKQIAWNFYQNHSKDYHNNLMQNYVRAYIAGKCGHNEEAINILKAKPNGSDYETIPYLDFLMGSFLMYKIDFEAASWLKKYVTYTIDKASAKEAYQKLAWCSLLQKDTSKYLIYSGLMNKNKALGSEEKLLASDLKKGIYPNSELLKARLFFDGGYLKQAEQLLTNLQTKNLKSNFQQIELEYRTARIAHEQKNWAKAIKHYTSTVELADKTETYMAPNACLQLGLIYKNLNYKENAKTYLNKVYEYSDYDYKSSIEQKAKAALLQINN